jgi:hypothetical protein
MEHEVKLTLLLVNFLNSKLYSRHVIDHSVKLITKMARRSLDWLWVMLMLALGSPSLGNVKVPKHVTKPVGTPFDYYHIKELTDIFSGESRQLLHDQLNYYFEARES